MTTNTSTARSSNPILVTGAAGKVGAVGRVIVEELRKKGLPVRAVVRQEDERSEALRALGAEIFVGDLTNANDVIRMVKGCKRVYFGMSVSPPYLEATVLMAAALLQEGNTEVLVNMSQMTVSSMTLSNQLSFSPQQRQHWLAEQTMNWSRLPVTHVRPTVFMEHFFFSPWPAESIARDGTFRLPFGDARTSPVAVEDIARVVAIILENPASHIGKVYELTGPQTLNMKELASEYAQALHRPVEFVNVPFDQWHEQELKKHTELPPYVYEHIKTMAKLHSENKYERMTHDVEKVSGKPAISIREYVSKNPIFKAASKNQ